MGKTFNSAQRAARKGKKQQQRKLKAKLHKAEFEIMKYGDRPTAMRVMARVEKREKLNKLANHTRKADRSYGGKAQ